MTWTFDNQGFFYTRYAPQQESSEAAEKIGTKTQKAVDMKLYYHKINTPQDADVLMYEDLKNPEWLFSTSMSVDGKYLMISTSRSAADIQLRHYVDLSGVTLDKKLEFKPIIGDWLGGFSFVHNIGTKFFFKTTYNAPMGKLISIDITQPARENWLDVIP